MAQQIPAKALVNGVGALAALIVVGWLGYSALHDDGPMVCEGRYPSSTRFDLKSGNGEPVALSELQARLGAGEWGILQNGRVVADGAGNGAPSLAVSLAKGTGAGYREDQERGGASFNWIPAEMGANSPKAACLTYRVFLPDNWKFGNGGTLPGLAIGSEFNSRGEPVIGKGAAVRPGWNRDGLAIVTAQYATSDGWLNPVAVSSKSRLPLGRWTTVEQEVILNDPGQKNGIVRIWLDGALAGENKKLALRGDDSLALAGIISDIHYGAIGNPATAPDDVEIQLSPFVVRWQ
jgi:hypothetical protein